MASLASVPDGRLLRALRELVVRDQQAEAELIRVLGEVSVRRLYLERGYSSLYAYCTEVLHMSEGVAFRRIKVARAARRFPALLERIRDGELHLSGAALLAPKLTREEPRRAARPGTAQEQACDRGAAGGSGTEAGCAGRSCASCRLTLHGRRLRTRRQSPTGPAPDPTRTACTRTPAPVPATDSASRAPRAGTLQGPVHGESGAT